MPSVDGYRCDQCGLHGIVCGGQSFTMIARIATAYCRSCGELSDVVVGDNIVEEEEEEAAVVVVAPDLGCCSECQSRLVYWRKGQRCPRCGGKMRETGECMEVD
jgi:ssDNA-binding Zn-finger/Zn-ribbon topoisomerase 1